MTLPGFSAEYIIENKNYSHFSLHEKNDKITPMGLMSDPTCIYCVINCERGGSRNCDEQFDRCTKNCYNSGMPLGACYRGCKSNQQGCRIQLTNDCERQCRCY
jgi:hypothetical protein